jgi:hypothetical protein
VVPWPKASENLKAEMELKPLEIIFQILIDRQKLWSNNHPPASRGELLRLVTLLLGL